jgi:hypothetical protein
MRFTKAEARLHTLVIIIVPWILLGMNTRIVDV